MAVSTPFCTAPKDVLRADDTADMPVAIPLLAALVAVFVTLDTSLPAVLAAPETAPVAVLIAPEVAFTADEMPLLTAGRHSFS